MKENTLPAAQALVLHELITPTEHGIASRVLARTDGGNVTLFAFDQGQGLSEHSAPYDALVMVLEGELLLTIGGEPVVAHVADHVEDAENRLIAIPLNATRLPR